MKKTPLYIMMAALALIGGLALYAFVIEPAQHRAKFDNELRQIDRDLAQHKREWNESAKLARP